MISLTKELCNRGFTVTFASGRRLIHLGAVKVDGEVVKEDILLEGEKTFLFGARGVGTTNRRPKSNKMWHPKRRLAIGMVGGSNAT